MKLIKAYTCFFLLSMIKTGMAGIFYDPFSRPANMQLLGSDEMYDLSRGEELKISMIVNTQNKATSFFVSEGKMYKVGDFFGSNKIMDIKNSSVTLWNGVLSFDVPIIEPISGDMQITENAE